MRIRRETSAAKGLKAARSALQQVLLARNGPEEACSAVELPPGRSSTWTSPKARAEQEPEGQPFLEKVPVQQLLSSVETGRGSDDAPGPCISAEAEEELFQKALRYFEIATEKELMDDCSDDMSVVSAGEEDDEPDALEHIEQDADCEMLSKEALHEADPANISHDTSMWPAGAHHPESFCRSGLLEGCSRLAPLDDDELWLMLSELRRRILPSGQDALRLVWHARQYLRSRESTVNHVPRPAGRLIIVGDLHGHLSDLLHILDHNGMPSSNNMYLFNGDFVDRGVWGPEVCLIVFAMKLLYKDWVFLNRGNHESETCTRVYGFKSHVQCAYPEIWEKLYYSFHEAFNELPLCHVIAKQVCVVHGGLTREPVCLQDIERLERGPVPVGDSREALLFQALLWSDPKDKAGKSDRGIGWHFSPMRTQKFLERSQLKMLIRSHECVDDGYMVSHDGRVITVFSASNYDSNNHACIATVDSKLQVTKGSTWKEEYVKLNWITLQENDTAGDVVKRIRKASSAAWDEEDQRAVLALANRCHGKVRRCSAKDRVLAKLRAKIFMTRTNLLEVCQVKDKLDNGSPADWYGTITPQRWAQAMQSMLRTPVGFPWIELMPYLVKVNAEGQVLYMNLVFRYYSKLARWLVDEFCAEWLAQIADDLDKPSEEVFDSLDVHGLGKLSFADIRPFFQQHAYGSITERTKEAMRRRELHFFALFRVMEMGCGCTRHHGSVGAITKKAFVTAMQKHRSEGARKCGNGHPLERGSKSCCFCCGGFSQAYQCDGCGRSISSTETWRWCDRCEFDLCPGCVRRRDDAAATRVRLREAHQKKRFEHWDNVEKVLGLLCSTQTDLHALFGVHCGEENRRKHVSKSEFVCLARDLLPDDEEAVAAFYEAVQDFLRAQEVIRLGGSYHSINIDRFEEDGFAVDELLDCLQIVDEYDTMQESRATLRGASSNSPQRKPA